MELFYRKLGKGVPLVILHGLYGSSDNWFSIARALSERFTVYIPDLRNHGNSPHHTKHTYEAMENDLYEFCLQHKLEKATFLGHSMGGKTSLLFGMHHPEMVYKMVVVDISPFGHPLDASSHELHTHRRIIQALQSVDPAPLTTREEADNALKSFIPSAAIRQFLLKNLKRNDNGEFYWSLNISALADHMMSIFGGIVDENKPEAAAGIRFPLLFIRGEYSRYIRDRDIESIKSVFLTAQIITIPEAGHWIHSEQLEKFLIVLHSFLDPS
jgi:pimeloyl-ACP methyl ester carboxylesterase